MKDTRLKDIAAFPAFVAHKLSKYGVMTVSQFVALTNLQSSYRGMRRALNMDEEAFDRLIAYARHHLPSTKGDLSPKPLSNYILNVNLEDEPAYSDAISELQINQTSQLPNEVSHIDRIPAIQDQGRRGTCVAFATVAAREFEQQSPIALSEQFVYWACKERDNHRGPGTYISTAMQCLADMGVCPSSDWPYNKQPIPNNEGQGPPPAGALKKACKYRIDNAYHLQSANIEDLKSLLVSGMDGKPQLIPFGVPVYPSWQNAETHRTGIIVMPFEDEISMGGHALCLVGYVDDNNAPGGGYFIFRNSWSEQWASENPYAAGYGMLPYAYMRKYGRSAFIMKTATKYKINSFPVKAGRTYKNTAIALILGVLILSGTFFANSNVQDIAIKQAEKIKYSISSPEKSDQQVKKTEYEEVMNILSNNDEKIDYQKAITHFPLDQRVNKEDKDLKNRNFRKFFNEIKFKVEQTYNMLFEKKLV